MFYLIKFGVVNTQDHCYFVCKRFYKKERTIYLYDILLYTVYHSFFAKNRFSWLLLTL